MTRPQSLVVALVGLSIVGYVILAALGDGTDAGALLFAVPTLVGLVTLQKVSDTHTTQTDQHAQNTAKLGTIDARVYQVEQGLASLRNGELTDKVAAGVHQALGTYLTTSSIVEQPFLTPPGDTSSTAHATDPGDIVARQTAAEEQAAKSRP